MAITPIQTQDAPQVTEPSGGVLGMAAATIARFHRDSDRISGLSGMHPAARRVHLARAYQTARDELGRLQQADEERRIAATAASDATIWKPGFGADVATARDARDRAARFSGHEHASAAAAMREADNAGDYPLATAIAREAAHRAAQAPDGQTSPWYHVAADYLGSRDDAGERPLDYAYSGQGASAPSALDALRKRSDTAAEAIVRSAHFYLPVPEGLPRDEWELRALAAQDPDAAARAADAARRADMLRPRR
jgi:hypothetical protein